jgi:MFS family permease
LTNKPCKTLSQTRPKPGERWRTASVGNRLLEGSVARRVGLACSVGTAIERYDFFIYGTAAAVVFAPQFFPQISELMARLAAFATFALGFIALPLGAVVMGHFGDRRGRKSMLVWSLLLMGGATFGIGLLPNYAQIGIWAAVLLVALRFIQGFALGGEWGAAALMAVEHAPQERRGMYGSLMALGLPAGLILANLVFGITSAAVTREQFAAWAWRIPFLASAALVGIGLMVRLSVAESPVFVEVRARHAELRMPVLDVFRRYKRTVLLAAGSHMSSSSLGYVATVYFVSYATRELHIPLSTVLVILVWSAALFAVSIFIFARWSDRLGRRRIMTWGLGALTLWSLVVFPLMDTKSVPLIALAVAGILALQGPYMGTQPAVFSELFPATVRYSGASLSVTIGTIVGGFAPLVVATLFGLAGTSSAITVYLATLSCVSWLCALGLKETRQRTLAHQVEEP